MVAHADLTADDAIILYNCAAGDARLRCDDHAFPDLHVVRDLDLVVDLSALADASLA
jgi:hypothetical protein